jgi:hypothetical protein
MVVVIVIFSSSDVVQLLLVGLANTLLYGDAGIPLFNPLNIISAA